MANICWLKKVECKSADENGNCTLPLTTDSGMFITGSRWCDSESFFIEHYNERGKELVEQYKNSQLHTSLNEQIELFCENKRNL